MRLGLVCVGKLKAGAERLLFDRYFERLINGARGAVEKDVTVVDVSSAGDWSQVKVWYDPSGNLGNTIYPTYGFIYQAAQAAAQKFADVQAKFAR